MLLRQCSLGNEQSEQISCAPKTVFAQYFVMYIVVCVFTSAKLSGPQLNGCETGLFVDLVT